MYLKKRREKKPHRKDVKWGRCWFEYEEDEKKKQQLNNNKITTFSSVMFAFSLQITYNKFKIIICIYKLNIQIKISKKNHYCKKKKKRG